MTEEIRREKVSFVDTVPSPSPWGARLGLGAPRRSRPGPCPRSRPSPWARDLRRELASRATRIPCSWIPLSRASRATSDDFPRVPPPRQVHPSPPLPRRRDGRPDARAPSDRRVRLLSSRLSPRRTWRPRESSRGRSCEGGGDWIPLTLPAAAAIFVCYADRSNISTAIIPMARQYHWIRSRGGC